ncbi:MAG TPA: NAD-dependent epimerase/dehydratase family protein [Candidatus Limnocylindria bacterium]|jgi:UDP-glucose 4-epimerase|nr:NAD-dependent epimerase/dehydratase family protein [Candidatus Limnocylindria bacterium]
MRVAMTGGGDFVGSHVLARMVGAGMEVTLVGPDTGPSRYTASMVTAGDVRFVRCDGEFSDDMALRSTLENVEAVVLLGYVAPSRASLAESFLDELGRNVAPILRIIHAAEGAARHVVLGSSVAVYGPPVRVPVRESDAARPQTPFAVAKLAAEHAVRATCSAAGMSASILRYSTVYGAGETGRRTIPDFIGAALADQPPVIDGDGLDEHDYIHVTDVAEGTLAALRHRADGIYNIGTGIGTTTVDLARLVSRLANTRASPVCRTWSRPDHDRMRIVCDTEAAGVHLGFTARRVLVDGITEEIGWLRAQLGRTPETPLAAA